MTARETDTPSGADPRMHNHENDGHHWQDCPGCDDFRAAMRRSEEDEPPEEESRCIDCGVALEPGTPPICEECVDD